MRQLLEYQADQIELVLWSHKIKGQVRGGKITPRWARFETVLPATAKPEKVAGLQSTIAHRLGAECRVQTNGGQLVIEVARTDSRAVTLSQIAMSQAPPLAALLGLELSDGCPLLLKIDNPDVAHVLIAGTTGCGKTTLIRSMIASLAWYNADGVQFYILDPKGRYDDLAWLPHLPLHSITSDIADQMDVLGMLVSEMEKRTEPDPRLILVIDELADLSMVGGDDVIHLLTRLTQRGREVGIHVLAGTQKPTALAIGSLVKSNFPTRIVGHVVSAEDAKVASGLPKTGAESLQGKGDFLLCLGGLTRFQATLPDAEFLHQLRRRIRQSGYISESAINPLAEYRKHVKSTLQVLTGGKQDERNAQHIIGVPGWIQRWWDGESLKYGHQSEIARMINKKNAGSDRSQILRVANLITEFLASSDSSTTSTGKS
jgi:S-DNA-T family DNA segregation ATPase FtsK/SpoIIIE